MKQYLRFFNRNCANLTDKYTLKSLYCSLVRSIYDYGSIPIGYHMFRMFHFCLFLTLEPQKHHVCMLKLILLILLLDTKKKCSQEFSKTKVAILFTCFSFKNSWQKKKLKKYSCSFFMILFTVRHFLSQLYHSIKI